MAEALGKQPFVCADTQWLLWVDTRSLPIRKAVGQPCVAIADSRSGQLLYWTYVQHRPLPPGPRQFVPVPALRFHGVRLRLRAAARQLYPQTQAYQCGGCSVMFKDPKRFTGQQQVEGIEHWGVPPRPKNP